MGMLISTSTVFYSHDDSPDLEQILSTPSLRLGTCLEIQSVDATDVRHALVSSPRIRTEAVPPFDSPLWKIPLTPLDSYMIACILRRGEELRSTASEAQLLDTYLQWSPAVDGRRPTCLTFLQLYEILGDIARLMLRDSQAVVPWNDITTIAETRLKTSGQRLAPRKLHRSLSSSSAVTATPSGLFSFRHQRFLEHFAAQSLLHDLRHGAIPSTNELSRFYLAGVHSLLKEKLDPQRDASWVSALFARGDRDSLRAACLYGRLLGELFVADMIQVFENTAEDVRVRIAAVYGILFRETTDRDLRCRCVEFVDEHHAEHLAHEINYFATTEAMVDGLATRLRQKEYQARWPLYVSTAIHSPHRRYIDSLEYVMEAGDDLTVRMASIALPLCRLQMHSP